MPRETTNIQVDKETWRRLNFRKEPGESFDDVVRDLLDTVEELEQSEE